MTAPRCPTPPYVVRNALGRPTPPLVALRRPWLPYAALCPCPWPAALLAREAGVPEGVFQVLPGRGSVIGNRFVTHEDVRKVVFTGSTEVGKTIMRGAANQIKRVTLELGGKSANIVFADADVDKAAATAPSGPVGNHRALTQVDQRTMAQGL